MTKSITFPDDWLEPERKLRLLIEALSDHALAMLDTVGRIVSWSVGRERINGWPERAVVGQHFSCLYAPEDVAAVKPDAALRMAAEYGRFEENAIRLRRDGSTYHAHVTTIAVRENGEVVGYGKVSRDITAEIGTRRRSA